MILFIPSVSHNYWFTSCSDSSDQQSSKFSMSIDQCHFVWSLLRNVFLFGNWGKTGQVKIFNLLLNVRCRFSKINWPQIFTFRFPYPLELTPSAAVHSTNPVCSITAQYLVPNDGLTEGHFSCVVALATCGAALQLNGQDSPQHDGKGQALTLSMCVLVHWSI